MIINEQRARFQLDRLMEILWERLEDVPVVEDADGRTILDDDWFIFCKGASVGEVWLWFDNRYSAGVGALMEGDYTDE